MDERGTRTLTESLSAAIEAALLEVRTATPARVESYTAADQRATVLPLMKRKSAAGEVLAPKPIGNVPVLHPGAGSFSLTWPVAVGNVGLLLCSDRSLDLWLAQTDVDGGQVDPQSRRHHQMTDGLFLPVRMRHWAGVPAAVAGTDPATDLVISAEDGDTFIVLRPDGEVRIKGSALRLGDPASVLALAMATQANANWQALLTLLTTWVVVPGDGGAALKAAAVALNLTGWPENVAASKVFGQ